MQINIKMTETQLTHTIEKENIPLNKQNHYCVQQ